MLNYYRCELGTYELKVDDPFLSALKKECALTESEMERIQTPSTSCAKISVAIDCLIRVTRELFLFSVVYWQCHENARLAAEDVE